MIFLEKFQKKYIDELEKLEEQESISEDAFKSLQKTKGQYFNELNLVCLYVEKGYFTKDHFFLAYGKGNIINTQTN